MLTVDEEAFFPDDAQAQRLAASRLAKPVGPSAGQRAGGALKGAVGGAGTGATIGSVVPGIGTGIGAVAGGVLGALGGALSADSTPAPTEGQMTSAAKAGQSAYDKWKKRPGEESELGDFELPDADVELA